MFTLSVHTICSLRPIAIFKRGRMRKSAMLRTYLSQDDMKHRINAPEYLRVGADCKHADMHVPNFAQFVDDFVHGARLGNLSAERRQHIAESRSIKPCTLLGIVLEDGRESLLAMVDGICCASPVQYSPQKKIILRLGQMGFQKNFSSCGEIPDGLEFAGPAIEKVLKISESNSWNFDGRGLDGLETRFEIPWITGCDLDWNRQKSFVFNLG